MNSITLYRGFVVPKLSVIISKGFSVKNSRMGHGESNWPGGLSLGRLDGLGLAKITASEQGGIPVCGRVTIPENLLREIPLIGIRRILDSSEGMSVGSIDSWPCHTMESVNRASEFTIRDSFLTPRWLSKMEAAVSTKEGEYVPFDEFRTSIEGNRNFIERFFNK